MSDEPPRPIPGIGRVLPDVVNAGATCPYLMVGGAWGLLSVAIAVYAAVLVLGVGGVVLVAASALLAVVTP